MGSRDLSRSAEVRARLDHPVIDADGHTVEFYPAFLDFLKQIGGADMADRFHRQTLDFSDLWYALSPQERLQRRLTRPAWWGVPMKNTLDRATASLPRLMYERLDEFGLDFAVVYPTTGLGLLHMPDNEMRQAVCRATNELMAQTFRGYADRMAPVAVIPMHTPQEAIAELEHAVKVLGMKAVVMASYVLRPRADGQGTWYDPLCLDSAYDYDPVWTRCLELKVTPTFHSSTQGVGSRGSVSNYMYNHIGHFAASGEALCKAAFMGGVTRRFPNLRMAFLEGGAGWACNLYGDLIGHWEKRNRMGMENYDPAKLDRERMLDLIRKYGDETITRKLDETRSRNEALYGAHSFYGASTEAAGDIDEFARCGITQAKDIRDLFVPSFYFGCEADDPTNAWAFDTKRNPFGARLNALYSSDIGHWDVPDMREVTAEAYELVEHGHITEADFRDFVFANPARMLTEMNPDFFKGTVIERSLSADK